MFLKLILQVPCGGRILHLIKGMHDQMVVSDFQVNVVS